MIFGKKSDVQKHLSGKHSMIPRKLFVDDAQPKAAEPMRDEQDSAEQSLSSREEQPETDRFQS